MKFFSKKKVAIILITIILCGFFGANNVFAVTVLEANTNLQKIQVLSSYTQAQKDLANKYNTILGNTWPSDTNEQAKIIKELGDTQSALNLSTSNSKTVTNTDIKPGDDNTPGLWSLITGGFSTMILALLSFLVSIFGWVLYLIAMVFDFALKFSISDINSVFNGPTVNTIWTLVRDTFNIFFIFVLLWIAISQIIGAWGPKAKATFGGLIISAIFINFSMFITKALIDIGNIFAVVIYNQISSGGTFYGTISSKFVNQSGVLSTFDPNITKEVIASKGIASIVSVLIQLGMILYACYLFIWGIVIFIGRGAMLIFLTIFSPVGFIGGALPKLKEHSDKWWKDLLNQIIVAPLFLFFMLIITRFLDSQEMTTITSVKVGGAPGFSGLLFYIIIIYLMKIALTQSKDLSGEVAKTTMAAAKGALALGAVVATGGTSLAMSGASGITSLGASVARGLGSEKLADRLSKGADRMSLAAKATRGTALGIVTGKSADQTGLVGNLARRATSGLSAGLKGTVGEDKITTYNKDKKKREADEDKRRRKETMAAYNKAEADRKSAVSVKKGAENAMARIVDPETKKMEASLGYTMEDVNKNRKAAEAIQASAEKTARDDANKKIAEAEQIAKSKKAEIDAEDKKLKDALEAKRLALEEASDGVSADNIDSQPQEVKEAIQNAQKEYGEAAENRRVYLENKQQRLSAVDNELSGKKTTIEQERQAEESEIKKKADVELAKEKLRGEEYAQAQTAMLEKLEKTLGSGFTTIKKTIDDASVAETKAISDKDSAEAEIFEGARKMSEGGVVNYVHNIIKTGSFKKSDIDKAIKEKWAETQAESTKDKAIAANKALAKEEEEEEAKNNNKPKNSGGSGSEGNSKGGENKTK